MNTTGRGLTLFFVQSLDVDLILSLLVTHPANRDRIAAAKRQQPPGIFPQQRPGKILLQGYTTVAETATLHFYKQQVGKKAAN